MSQSLGLDNGWKQFYDDAQQAYYYHNSITGETQWEAPSPATADVSSDTVNMSESFGRLTALPIVKKPKTVLPPLKIDVASVQMHNTSAHNFSFGNKKRNKKVYCDVTDASDPLAGTEYSVVEDEKYSDMDDDDGPHQLAAQTDKLSFSSVPPSAMSTHSASMTPMLVGGSSQDYLGLARTYQIQRPYCDRNADLICVLCNRNVCTSVFFPCQHRCVCQECIVSESLCTDAEMRKVPKGFCNCPLCAGIIKKILPFENGNEEEKYWQWVMEVSPELPQGFMRNFRHSAAVIEKVYVNSNYAVVKPQRAACCTIS